MSHGSRVASRGTRTPPNCLLPRCPRFRPQVSSRHRGSTSQHATSARTPGRRTLTRMPHRWDPVAPRPEGSGRPFGSTRPVAGLTRNQATGRRWRQTSPGMYVPSDVDRDVVEQRILEQVGADRAYGAVTAWAALRWHGATFFDGTCDGGFGRLPVPLVSHTKLNPDPRFTMTQDQLGISEWSRRGWHSRDHRPAGPVRRGTPDRKGAREGQRNLDGGGRKADLGAAVRPVRRPPRALDRHPGRAGRRTPGGRRLPVPTGVSDATWCWLLDAELPEPLLNREVYDLDGRLIGIPDLFDPDAGLVGEYQGEDHKDGKRHRADVEREERFRDHGLEFFEVVGGDLSRRQLVVERMLNARRRAKFLPPESRAWTLRAAARAPHPETLDCVPRPHRPGRLPLAQLTDLRGTSRAIGSSSLGQSDPNTRDVPRADRVRRRR